MLRERKEKSEKGTGCLRQGVAARTNGGTTQACAGFPVEAASWRHAVQGRGGGRCEGAWLQMLQALRAIQWTHACGRRSMSCRAFLVTFGGLGM